MIRRPPRSTRFPYTTALPICVAVLESVGAEAQPVAFLLSTNGSHGEPLEGDAPVFEICDPDRLVRSEEHTSELQSRQYLVCRLLLEKKKNNQRHSIIY